MSDLGFVCSLCGLSDLGAARFLGFGYKLHPCGSCIEHFRPLLPPEPDVAPEDEPPPSVEDPVASSSAEGSSSLHLVEESIDTPDTPAAGTLW